MNTLILHGPPDRSELRRWGLSAALVVGLHASLLLAGVAWYVPPDVAGTASEPILLDLESAPPTPEQQLDLAPGPEMTEAEPPPPEPEQPKEIVEEQIAPTPPQEKAEVVAPPEKKPEPKPVEKPKPKPKPIERPKKPTDAPAPRTSAAPQASQAARANYNGILSSHLRSFKQYPSGARAAGEQGTAVVAFTVTRGGGASGVLLVRSSGYPALDAEAVATVRRAQPLPAPPADMPASALSFSVPFSFTIR